jgi:hypothetical protein
MKKCGYCGFEDEEDAVTCHQCGKQAFTEATTPADAVKPGTNLQKLMLRFLIAAAVWLIVSGISIYVAWGNAADSNDCRWEQYLTQHTLKLAAGSIAAYRQKFGVSPQSLGDLAKIPNNDPFQLGDDEHPFDAWGHPMVLSTNTTNLVITSYGRDGKPGGIGLDCDLTTENWNPKEARPTFQQFLHDMPTGGMILSCFVCGSFAGLLSFLIVKIPDLSRYEMIKLVFKLIVMVLAAVFMASVIAGLHIPTHEH